MTKRLAVLGHPVAHSRSPAMHNAALEALGMEDWHYEAIDVRPAEFARRIAEMPGEGFIGANVTVPHKEAALAAATGASPAAREIGAANTLTFSAGAARAENTDAPGLLAALGESVEGRAALVLGAGGAARAAAWALSRGGAAVEVWNRTAERGGELARQLGVEPARGKLPLPAGRYELIVNATSVGMGGSAGSPEDLPLTWQELAQGQTVVDLAYGEADTGLVRAARQAGCRVVDGLELLVHQGALSFRIWTERDPPLDVMLAAARGP